MKMSQGLYYLVNFFILIGEYTQKIIFYPIFFVREKKIKLPKIQVPVKIKYFLLGCFITSIFVSILQSYFFIRELPSPYNIGKVNYPLSTHIYDRNNTLLYEIYREQNRTPVILKELPPYVAEATIAIEDKDFYKHQGVAVFSGMIRAVKEMIINKNLQGGSTITQQLVKTALLTPERTLSRKIKEVILAIWTEKIYSKEQILEMYFNQVPYGGSSYGIEEASKTYFGKKAKDLTIEEAALLAGLPQAPSLYSPYINPEIALKRRNEVLTSMKNQGYINEESKVKSQKSKVEVLPPKTAIRAPHFVFYSKNQLENYYGIKTVEEGGLKVKTTLDYKIQEQAEKILKEELDKINYLNVTNGAILITRPSTGEILAMVGSVDYFNQPTGAFNVTTALRQPGSSIKPIMYSYALQKGYTAASILDDSPAVFNIAGSESYRPVNYDNKFHGKVPLRYALANSYNIPAVRTLNNLGVDNFIDFATKMGINTWNDRSRYGLSLTLGGGEVTMVDMAEAFGVIANQGYRMPINYFQKIEDNTGNILREMTPFKIKEIDPAIAFIISDILSDNFARTFAFGSGSALEIPGYKVAVKTGTTNEKKDNWTIGYTPEFLVVVWVGNNDNTPMNPYLTSGITGAAPIWNRVMSYLLKNYGAGNKWYEKPDNIVEKNCYYGRKEYFVRGTENTANCSQSSLATPTPKP
ncbi:penicillin-binding protein [Candidatus Roizmanbacteria bacterium CG06_land_8_20_14_3_00_34_14]|uniref:Penicillin-binding protein n=2 Tax=Candidatus Roizmaniibacteriota TaxID=1752723 RepID=A0A2M7AUA4_9BACT|nr:MAG: penicillin-binding protein [Candidatus Roizmanbacteria bacterium CG07_land_8_20_14_0_80_34_15]PIU74188.1 MAG: penicillin-binding protein [Candidatus Roizmanbacteria bacterium CG06_land_8_20_14_3_00_34_14]